MKQRLVGAIVLGCLAIIFLPILLDGEGVSPPEMNIAIPTAPAFPEPLEVGMTQEQADRYQKNINDALQKAEESLSAQTMKIETRKKTAAYKNRKKEVRPEVEAEANEMRVYKALANMQLGKNSDGTPLPDGVFQVKLDKKELIEMRYREDHSFDEMARQLGVTPTTVRQRVSRAIRSLRGIPFKVYWRFNF